MIALPIPASSIEEIGMSSGISGNDRPDVSIVIPSWNTLDITRNCLNSLFDKDHDCSIEVIVIDNGSQDGSADMVAHDFPQVRLIRNALNEYYSKACNQGAAIAHGRFICMLNSDTLVSRGSLKGLIQFLEENPTYGAAAPRLDNPDGTVQPICRRFPGLMEVVVDQFSFSGWPLAQRYKRRIQMNDFDHLKSRDVEQPPGTCIVMRANDFRHIGGFDENLPLFYSDVDLCLRIWRSGRPIRFVAESRITHIGSVSVLRHPLWRAEYMRNQVHYFRKNMGQTASFFVRTVILVSAGRIAVGTLLGPRPWGEKRQLLSQLKAATGIALSVEVAAR